MPAIITKGAFSAQGYGFGASAATGATYIEDVFSTYLYTGNGSTNTITNNIDLSNNGGMVWIKNRLTGATSHAVYDTNRGVRAVISTDSTSQQLTSGGSADLYAFNNNGFTLGSSFYANVNNNAESYVSWTFRKQPKFFDVVTYTGTGSARTIAHNLGSVPGMIIVKRTDTTSNWAVYQNSLTSASYYLKFNLLDDQALDTTVWNGTAPTSSVFSVGTSTLTNASGGTYVAYIYAHNAGGFGTAGTDNVISCGSFTASALTTVTLGYEVQYVLFKYLGGDNWNVFDVMRGASVTKGAKIYSNLDMAESQMASIIVPTATGFTFNGTNYGVLSGTMIYMAIRRGPMKTPTDATKVFSPNATSATTGTTITTNFPVDLQIMSQRAASGKLAIDRLRGISTNTTESSVRLVTTLPDAEGTSPGYALGWDNLGFKVASPWSGISSIYWNFRRAPGFFDEVCYTGTGAARTVTHNLGVVPQLILVKTRSSLGSWAVYSAPTLATYYMNLNTTDGRAASTAHWNDTTPTSSVFTVGTSSQTNNNGVTLVAYLFTTLAGVSKVGSYTGTGAAQNIDCGFSSSARFILIKRYDIGSSGSWYVYDSARGISASNDPYLTLNTSNAEVTNTNYVDTYATGFSLTSTAPAELNASGGSYLFLAIA